MEDKYMAYTLNYIQHSTVHAATVYITEYILNYYMKSCHI